MKRPSFQFYPNDWTSDLNLRRCSPAARGVWIDVLCALHNSDDGYGFLRWPIKEVADAVKASMSHVRELVEKRVLRGSDSAISEALVYVPRHGRKDGPPVTLIAPQSGPIWYSKRLVVDDHIRTTAGASTRFGATERTAHAAAPEPSPESSPDHAPARRQGERQGEDQGERRGDGSSSSSSSSATQELRQEPRAVPGGTGAFAPSAPEIPPLPSDPKTDLAEAIWAVSVPMLTAAGVSERNARSFIGKLRKHNADGDVLAALQRCAAERSGSPVEFLQGCLRVSASNGGNAETMRLEHNARENAEAKRRLLASFPQLQEDNHA